MGVNKMKKSIVLLGFLATIHILLFTASYAFSSAPPIEEEKTITMEVVSPAEQKAAEELAKKQIENLKNIALNSNTIEEGQGKIINDLYSGKTYLYSLNSISKKALVSIALNKKEDVRLRFAAIGVLNPDDPPEAFDLRVKIFQDKSENIRLRRYVSQSLDSTKRKDKQKLVLPILIEALNDEDLDIVANAANGLETIRDESAIEPLIKAVRKYRINLDNLIKSGWKEYERQTQPPTSALSCSIRTLGHYKDKRSIPVLIEVLEDPYLNHMSLSDVTKGWAVIALQRIGDKSVIDELEKLVQTTKDHDVRRYARDVIEELKNKK